MTKHLIITGGSKGIGKKTIARFLENNWKVLNLSRTPCDFPNVTNVAIDLSKANSIHAHSAQLQSIVNDASQLCLVHNAAYYTHNTILSQTIEELEQAFAVNIVAPSALNQLFIPFMKPSSSIIYIGSTLSEMAVPGVASYIVAKHAMIGLMRATCQDLNGKFIHTVCVCPGLTDTEMLRAHMDQQTIDSFVTHKISAKRLVDPAEIAEVVYFCANSPVINGSIIHANLGQIAE